MAEVIRTVIQEPSILHLPCRSELLFEKGALVGHRRGSKLAELVDPDTPRTDLVIRGVVMETVTSVGFDDGEVSVSIEPGYIDSFDTGSSSNQITANHVGQLCYAYDGGTLYATDNGGTLSPAGRVRFVDDDGKVALYVDPDPLDHIVVDAPAMQAVNATLASGTITINSGINVASDSEVIPLIIGAITGSTNFGSLGELKASRVNGGPGTGTVVIQAYNTSGALDSDAAGAIRVVILTPKS